MNIKKVAFRCFFHGHLGIDPEWRVFTDLRIRYTDSATGESKLLRLDGIEFVRRIS